jgi:hypothetical protein
MELTGTVYAGKPPPDYPVTPVMGNPDADLGPVPPIEEVTPAVTGSLTLGRAKGAPTVGVVGPEGGTVEVTKRGDPLKGLTITVPPDALPATVSFSVSSRPIKGHSYGPLIDPASPLITVEAGDVTAEDFISVRIPVRIPDGSFAMAFYVDPASGGLEGLPLLAQDASGLTIGTRHFSSFFVSLIELADLPDYLDSGFRPGVDDWQFTNYGSYIKPNGHCSGQSVSAMYHYIERHKKGGASSLFGLYDNNGAEPTTDLWLDDSDGYRLASMVQHDTDWSSMANKLFINSQGLADWMHRAALRYAIAVTGEPQELFIYSSDRSSGHAIIAYRVTPSFIQVADPNFPGKHRAIRWDESTQDLRPYSSGANAGDIAQNGVTVYTQILYAAKSASVDWQKVAQRWAEFDAGTIGDGVFPSPVLEAQNAAGDWLPLVDGYQASSQQLTVRLRDPSAVDNVMLQVFRGLESTPAASAKNTGHEAKVTIDLEDGDNPLGFSLRDALPAWPSYEYVDFIRLSVKPAPVGTMYTLNLRFDGGCDPFFDPTYGSWSRVQPLPIRIHKESAFADYAADFQEKHLVVTGTGTFDPKTGKVSIPSLSATFTRDMTHEDGTPLTGRETLVMSLSGTVTNDPAVEWESFPLEASGTVDVDYPQRYRATPGIMCSATVTEGRLKEGWADGGL